MLDHKAFAGNICSGTPGLELRGGSSKHDKPKWGVIFKQTHSKRVQTLGGRQIGPYDLKSEMTFSLSGKTLPGVPASHAERTSAQTSFFMIYSFHVVNGHGTPSYTS